MIKRFCGFGVLTLMASFVQGVPADAFEIDGIAAVVHAYEGEEIITRSDIERPDLMGRYPELDDEIFKRMVLLDATKHKITSDEEDVERTIRELRRQNNMTEEEFEQVFRSAGKTAEEGKLDLARLKAINTMLDYKIRSRIMVPQRVVEEAYRANPQYKEASYELQYVHVPYSASASKKKQLDELKAYVLSSKDMSTISWSDPFQVAEDELADDKKFIAGMKVDQVSTPRDTGNGFEMFWMRAREERRLLTFEESYESLVHTLQKDKYEQMAQEYRDELARDTAVMRLVK